MIQTTVGIIVIAIAVIYFVVINIMNYFKYKYSKHFEDKDNKYNKENNLMENREYFDFNDLDHTRVYEIVSIGTSNFKDGYYIDITYRPASGFPYESCRLRYSNILTRDIDYFIVLSKIKESNKKVFENLKNRGGKENERF